jgi:hypothetical protein
MLCGINSPLGQAVIEQVVWEGIVEFLSQLGLGESPIIRSDSSLSIEHDIGLCCHHR